MTLLWSPDCPFGRPRLLTGPDPGRLANIKRTKDSKLLMNSPDPALLAGTLLREYKVNTSEFICLIPPWGFQTVHHDLYQSSLRAVVITGQGRIFSAGVDLPRVLDGGLPYLRSFLPALKKAFEALFCFPKPVVAAINGHAIAGGCVLACATDHRLMASQSGRIGIPELLVGVPFPTLALEIVRLVTAPTHFRTMVYRGATFSPEEATEKGLVDATVEPEKLLDEATAVAEALAGIPPVFAITKRQICDPVMKRIREEANRFDPAIEELWTAPATLAAIKEYVARTFKKSQG